MAGIAPRHHYSPYLRTEHNSTTFNPPNTVYLFFLVLHADLEVKQEDLSLRTLPPRRPAAH
jgi:hypothetical protein